MRVRRIRLAAGALLVGAALAPSAAASTYTIVLHAYETSGTISPCQFSSAQLAAALKGVDTYGAQYFADFTNAIQSALAARAAGACTHNRAPAARHRVRAAASAPVPGPVTAPTNAGVPAPLLLMAAIAAAFALCAAVAGVFRVRGWDPVWLAGWRHSWAEAGYRLGGTWSEFVDWLRSDR
jgi:hypothetical protein